MKQIENLQFQNAKKMTNYNVTKFCLNNESNSIWVLVISKSVFCHLFHMNLGGKANPMSESQLQRTKHIYYDIFNFKKLCAD